MIENKDFIKILKNMALRINVSVALPSEQPTNQISCTQFEQNFLEIRNLADELNTLSVLTTDTNYALNDLIADSNRIHNWSIFSTE